MIYPVVCELAADGVPVAVTCRVLEVSTSGYYEWHSQPASDRAWEQAHLMESIRPVHQASYGTYDHRRVHAKLVLGQGTNVGHGRVERLTRHTGLQGVHPRPRPQHDHHHPTLTVRETGGTSTVTSSCSSPHLCDHQRQEP